MRWSRQWTGGVLGVTSGVGRGWRGQIGGRGWEDIPGAWSSVLGVYASSRGGRRGGGVHGWVEHVSAAVVYLREGYDVQGPGGDNI